MWHKLAFVQLPKSNQDCLYSHMQVPVSDCIEGDLFRVYFAGRTSNQISHVSYLEININKPEEILNISKQPVLSPGGIGTFDQYGVYPSCILNINNQKFLYYIAWIRGKEDPLFYASIGLAISNDGGLTFKKYSNVPILGISEYDPCLVTAPNVIKDGDIFRLTYVSGLKWERGSDGKLYSFYHIKQASSTDGITWDRKGEIAIDFNHSNEKNIARSAVIQEDGIYKMWYSYVPPSVGKYRIGYAESSDFKTWERKDENAGINVSENRFDNEMVGYPYVIKHKEKKYMFYNGNDFGKKGFGLAVWNE